MTVWGQAATIGSYDRELFVKHQATIGWIAAAVVAMGLGACDQTPTSEASASGASAQAPAEKDSWKEFKLGETAMTVSVPAEPQCQNQDAGNGLRAQVCASESEKTGLIVNVTKLPAKVAAAQLAKVLDGAMNGSAKGMNAQAIKVSDVTVGGLKAKDFSVDSAQGEIRSRLVIKSAQLVD